MKNFFKKLSFVMALAMIISVIAPAAGAFAATAPALSAKGTKYLYLGNATKSSLDLNVTNKPAGASYVWSSSKKTIATVDKYGVVKGVKQGKTTVSLAITKKDGSKTTLSVDFVVRNNIKSFTSIVDADGADLAKLVAGKAYDLNGKFTTNGGSTTSTSSVARWSVDSDKATIDVKTGVFTATEAGTYKVTVNAFETATGADAWVALNDKTSTAGVKATGTFEVTVITSFVSSRQVDQDTLELTFDGDMSKSTLDKDLVLYQIIGSTAVTTGAEKIKKVSYDTTGKIVTVDVYANFTAGGSYKLVAGELTVPFTAATAKLTDIAKIVLDDV
ncbi:MAG: Ig-like domain-containing protein, partial [Mobilitalea sp.]